MSDDADDHGHATKHPRLAELEGMVRDGRIDTIVVAFTDMQGRLMGKRVQGQAFLDGVIDHGAHFCTYLLGHGHGDEHARGLRAHELGDRLRRLDRRADLGPAAGPALAARTAMVLADTIDEETGKEIPVSPRTILKRQVARAAEAGFAVKAGSEFEFYVLKDSWEELAEARLAGPEAVRLLQRGLPPPPGDQGRAAPPAPAQPDDRGQRPDRVQQGRGGATASTRSTSATTTSSSRPTGASSSSTARRRSPTSTAGASRSWPSPTTAGPAHRATCT